MHARLEINLRRVAVGNIIDSIDQLDPASRTRQQTALSHLQGRHFARRFTRASLVSLSLIAALCLVAAR